MVAESEQDRRLFREQERILEKERNMLKAGREPQGYGMKDLFKETQYT